MKHITKLMIAVLLLPVLAMSGCSESESDAVAAFEQTMSAFKSGIGDEIDKYYSFDRVTAYIDKADGEEFRDTVLSTLSAMDYEINSTKSVNSESVILNVTFETADFSKIVSAFIDEAVKLTESGEYQKKLSAMSDEEYNRIMTETMKKCIKDGVSEKRSQTADVTMIKDTAGKWIIGGNSEEVLGIMFADLSEALDYLT